MLRGTKSYIVKDNIYLKLKIRYTNQNIFKEKVETVLRLNSIELYVRKIVVRLAITVEEVESIIDRNIRK